jgi:hypothetical protein
MGPKGGLRRVKVTAAAPAGASHGSRIDIWYIFIGRFWSLGLIYILGRRIAIIQDRRADAVICSNRDCDGVAPCCFRRDGPTLELLGAVPQGYRRFLVNAPPSVSELPNTE